MEKILRSVIFDETSGTDREDITDNLQYLLNANIHFVSPEDQEIWNYVRLYYKIHSSTPSIGVVNENFKQNEKHGILERIEDLRAVGEPYTGSDFRELVRHKENAELHEDAMSAIKDAALIVKDGLKFEDGAELEGARDAFDYLLRNSDDFLHDSKRGKQQADVIGDHDDMWEEFEDTVENPQDSWGIITWLDPIDQKCRGVKNGDLWIHAGYAGHLKTTYAINWAWKAATVGVPRNVYYYSVEMSYEQLRRIIHALHSNHPKFQMEGQSPVDYRVIRDGVHEDGSPITDDEIRRFRTIVDDFEERKNNEYGKLIVEEPSADPTIPHIKQRMEMAHRQHNIDVAFIDYLGLLNPSSSTRDYYTGMNSVIREAKQLTLNFNDGEGIPVVALHQINREGKKYADKNDGRYKLQALADANEAERSSDVITYTYLNDDLREQEEVKIGCLKNRDNPHFKQFHAPVHFPTRFLTTSSGSRTQMDSKSLEEMDNVEI